MKHQTNKILVVLFIAGLALLLSGCPPDPADNNRNAPDQNTSSENTAENAEKDVAYKKCSEEVDPELIKSIIDRLPSKIKNQFRNNIEYKYDTEDHTLIFSGYLEGKGNLYKLIDSFRKYQGDACIRKILLVGAEDSTDFEWRIDPGSGDVSPCREADVKKAIDDGPAKQQIGKNLRYTYSEKTITFENYIYGKGKFSGMIDKIVKYEGKNCVSKIVFKGNSEEDDKKELLAQGFGWQICEDGQCECFGGCAPCPCMIPIDANKETNSSQNANSNASNSN